MNLFFLKLNKWKALEIPSAYYGQMSGTVHLETEIVPLAMYQRFQKYFQFSNVKSCDAQIASIRSIKSMYELTLMEQSGEYS